MNQGYYKIYSVFFVSLAILLGAFVYPAPFNEGLQKINETTERSFRLVKEVPFKLGLDLQGGVQLLYQADLSDVPEHERKDRMDGLRDLIERRVDQFGVAEPMVQVKGDRLVVELAGVIDPAEAMRMIGETPFLEFKEIAGPDDVTQEMRDEIDAYNEKAKEKAENILREILDGADFSEKAIEFSEDFFSAQQGGDLGLFERGDMVSAFEEAVFSLSEGEITENLVETEFGYHIIKKTQDENEDGKVGAKHILIEKKDLESSFYDWKRTELTGQHLKTARYYIDQTTRAVIIELDFTAEGGQVFEKITERNVGNPLAIFLDGMSIIDTTGDGRITSEDIYAPIIQEKISGGKAVITGESDLNVVRDIVNRLRSGALPVPIELISYQSVGPTLGMDSLESSLNAGILGFFIAILFVVLVYRLPGALAALSLGVYVVIVLTIFKLIPVTLTLSGIAGLILSIGMAVDANILIFSRMKEELKLGRNLKDSIDNAFNRAWPSIRDGNLTTLIVAFLLFFIGTSFVKGFALTLIIGILISIFSAMVVTRVLLKSFEDSALEKRKSLWKKND